MAAPYWLHLGDSARTVTADFTPNQAYRAGWRDCIEHLRTHSGEVFICDDSGAGMYSIQDDFVLDVVDSHPHALQYSAKQRAAMRISIPEVAEALGLSDKVIAALAEL